MSNFGVLRHILDKKDLIMTFFFVLIEILIKLKDLKL